MQITSVADIMAIAKSRGFAIVVNPGPPPMPVLRPLNPAVKELATPVLMSALKAWRSEIIREVLGK